MTIRNRLRTVARIAAGVMLFVWCLALAAYGTWHQITHRLGG